MNNIDWNQRYIESDTPWDTGVPSEQLKQVLASGLIQPGPVLELGCGTGINAIWLAQSGFQVTAVDLSPVALEKAKTKASGCGVSIAFIQADVTKLPDDGSRFPFVFDRGTYHVVRNVDLEGFQKTLSRVVAPGGYYVVVAGNTNEDSPPEGGPPRVTAADLCRELEFDDFDLVSLEETHFHGIKVRSQSLTPLAWRAVLRRRVSAR